MPPKICFGMRRNWRLRIFARGSKPKIEVILGRLEADSSTLSGK